MKVRIFGIGILALLSACSKEIPKAALGEGVPLQTIATGEIPEGARPRLVQNLSGSIGAVSDADLERFQKPGTLPFSGVISHPSRAEALLEDAGQSIPYSKRSNELLRVIHAFPPRTAVVGVKRFVLKLKDLTLFVPEGGKIEETLSKQAVCLLDGKSCVGTNAAKDSLGASFKEGAVISGNTLAESSEFKKKVLVPESKTDFVFVRPGDLEIDLLARFELTESAKAIDFVFQNSAQYSTHEHYRKFRLALGEQIFAAGGSIELEFEVNPGKVPTGWDKQNVLPIEGAGDQILSAKTQDEEFSPEVEEVPAESVEGSPKVATQTNSGANS